MRTVLALFWRCAGRESRISTKPEALSTNNACELGKWIVGEAIKYAQLEEYLTLKAEHVKFHLAAADLVRRANAGERLSEDMVLGSKSEFRDVQFCCSSRHPRSGKKAK